MKVLKFSIPLLGLVCLSFSASAFSPTPASASPQTADSWIFPLGNDGYTYTIRQNAKYGTRVENTDYTARNLDLILGGANRITCFDLGGHRLFHAGVDLYRIGSSAAGAQVKAVANGVVEDVGSNYPGLVVILRHDMPSGPPRYSLYGHLQNSNPPAIGAPINKGDVLGTVLQLGHDGHFPEFHSDGDDSHLHFEIRTFADATTVGLPSACNVSATTRLPPTTRLCVFCAWPAVFAKFVCDGTSKPGDCEFANIQYNPMDHVHPEIRRQLPVQ